jgi:lipopolysaccharide export system protein LptC
MAGIDVAEPVAAEAYLQGPALSWAAPVGGTQVRRRRGIRVAKYVLPMVGLALLSSIALWPEIARNFDQSRVTWRRLAAIDPDAGQMLHPRYRGLDQRQHPYTISAEAAQRSGPERVNLLLPVGDMTLENGTWLLLRARTGVFMQHSNELDLARDVTLYRQDGTVMTSATATMNLKQGAATSDDFTHAEGPFGTLDAQGFTLVDKGEVVQFHGPAKLVLNGAH